NEESGVAGAWDQGCQRALGREVEIAGGVDDIMRIEKKQGIQLPLLHFLLDLADLALVPLRLQTIVGGRVRHGCRQAQFSNSAEAAYIRRNAQRRCARQGAQKLPAVCHDASYPAFESPL